MIEIIQDKELVKIIFNKKQIVFNSSTNEVSLDELIIETPWEYEKWDMLLELQKISDKFIYNFSIDNKHVVIIPYDSLEITESVVSFLGDIDILVIHWNKNTVKTLENIEAKVVIPYWEEKFSVFQHSGKANIEAVASYKVKWQISWDVIEYVNLEG